MAVPGVSKLIFMPYEMAEFVERMALHRGCTVPAVVRDAIIAYMKLSGEPFPEGMTQPKEYARKNSPSIKRFNGATF